MALDLWEFVTGTVVFGLGFLLAIAMFILQVMRERNNFRLFRYGEIRPVDVGPISPKSIHYYEVSRQINAVQKVTIQNQAQKNGASTIKITTTTTPVPQQGVASYPIIDDAFLRFKTYWEGLYVPMVSLVAPVLVAFILIGLYIALYLGLGTFTRADAVVADYLTWIAVAFTYPGFLIIYLYMTGAYRTPMTLAQLFGIGLMAFLVGISYALGVICSANNQWLGLGAGLLLHVLIGLIAIYLLSDRYMVDCFLKKSNACTLIRAGVGLTWSYYTVKTLFLILGPEYTVVLDASGAYIAQTVTDLVFYIILIVIAYVVAARIEMLKKIKVLATWGIQSVKYYPSNMYPMSPYAPGYLPQPVPEYYST